VSDRVACEGVLMFVNAAIASTGQREFYDSAGAYLKTLRRHDWRLGPAAEALGTDVHSLRARLARAGLEGLTKS
jgi:hypothetical protein